MKKILLTGATGFIGRHCLPMLLEKGYEVHAVSSKVPEKNNPDIKWHQVNLLNLEQGLLLMAEVQPSHLLHFSWCVEPGRCLNSMENFQWVQSSLSLLQAFSKYGGQRVVMAGTCAEYDWKYGYCSEKLTPLVPDTVYGKCKHSIQIMLDAFSKQTGLSSTWGRIFFVYGPYEHPKRLVPSVILSLLRAEPALCTHGSQIRDYLYVQDVADAFVTLLESDVQGPVNIASGCPVALRDIVYKIAHKLNRQDLIRLGSVPTSENEQHFLIANVRRLFEEVGWFPKYDLDQGLERTIEWWKNKINIAI